jgi:hypothetical protein
MLDFFPFFGMLDFFSFFAALDFFPFFAVLLFFFFAMLMFLSGCRGAERRRGGFVKTVYVVNALTGYLVG